jgi:chromosome segregation ATPase
MPTLEEELQKLQAERDNAEADISNLSKTLQDAQAKLSVANATRTSLAPRVAAVEQLVKEITITQGTVKTLREKVASERAAVEKGFSDLQKRINAELPEERRNAINTVIAKIDAAIAEAKKKSEEAQVCTVEAEKAIVAAKQKTATANAEHQAAGVQFHQLPQEIEAARGRVAKLTGEVKTAMDAGRVNEAYMRLLELKQAMDELPKVNSEEYQKKLADQIAERRQATMTAQDDLVKAGEDLNKRKAEQADAEGNYKKKVQEREADLKAALSTPQ